MSLPAYATLLYSVYMAAWCALAGALAFKKKYTALVVTGLRGAVAVAQFGEALARAHRDAQLFALARDLQNSFMALGVQLLTLEIEHPAARLASFLVTTTLLTGANVFFQQQPPWGPRLELLVVLATVPFNWALSVHHWYIPRREALLWAPLGTLLLGLVSSEAIFAATGDALAALLTWRTAFICALLFVFLDKEGWQRVQAESREASLQREPPGWLADADGGVATALTARLRERLEGTALP